VTSFLVVVVVAVLLLSCTVVPYTYQRVRPKHIHPPFSQSPTASLEISEAPPAKANNESGCVVYMLLLLLLLLLLQHGEA